MIEYTKKALDYTLIAIFILAVASLFTEKLSFVEWFASGVPGMPADPPRSGEFLFIGSLFAAIFPSIYPVSRQFTGWGIVVSGIGVSFLYFIPAGIDGIYSDISNIPQEAIVILICANAIYGTILSRIFCEYEDKRREVKKVLCGKCGQYLGNEDKYRNRCDRCGFNRVKKEGVDEVQTKTVTVAGYGWPGKKKSRSRGSSSRSSGTSLSPDDAEGTSGGGPIEGFSRDTWGKD